jgi:glycosyltransferase involved in cell wall biosynthesis
VIVPDLGALPETIVAPDDDAARFTGWLVPPRDIPALAACVRQALQLSAAMRAEIGARARAFVLEAFSLSRMQEQTLAVYDELLGTDLAARFRQDQA